MTVRIEKNGAVWTVIHTLNGEEQGELQYNANSTAEVTISAKA